MGLIHSKFQHELFGTSSDKYLIRSNTTLEAENLLDKLELRRVSSIVETEIVSVFPVQQNIVTPEKTLKLSQKRRPTALPFFPENPLSPFSPSSP